MNTATAEFIGKYELRRLIGRGATSSVHLAWDPFRQTEVAIKRLRREIVSDPQRGRHEGRGDAVGKQIGA